MKTTVYIKTWGCQMNEYDSSMLINLLKKENGYAVSKSANQADILILNTCSIREKAQEKLFHQLGRWKSLKKNNPELIIAVGGCVATQEGEKIYKRARYVDIIFGTQTLHRLPMIINTFIKTKKPIIDVSFPKIEKFNKIILPQKIKPIASISIMEGCNKRCTFCIVPYTRGREISRNYEDIITEISRLAQNGTKEIHLLGQNVNAYKGEKSNKKICTFSELLRSVSYINGIERIRFITSHPMEFKDDIIQVYKDVPQLVSFLHLPVQSGSNRILKLMKRGYTADKYRKLIDKLISHRPDIQISSDFIIGFPGETHDNFMETIKLIKKINFDMSYSFIYSARPGTRSAKFKDHVTLEEKKERLQILQKQINQQTLEWSKKMLGTTQKVLVEGLSLKNKDEYFGKTENNRIVKFQTKSINIGKIIKLKIINLKSNLLYGIHI